MDTPNMLIT